MIEAYLHQWATYWAPGPPNLTGGRDWLPPVFLRCRWEQNTSKITNKEGREVVARDAALFAVAIDEAGRLALGRHDMLDPTNAPSHEPQRVRSLVALDGTIDGYKVWM